MLSKMSQFAIYALDMQELDSEIYETNSKLIQFSGSLDDH
jgi:hypothetical protein